MAGAQERRRRSGAAQGHRGRGGDGGAGRRPRGPWRAPETEGRPRRRRTGQEAQGGGPGGRGSARRRGRRGSTATSNEGRTATSNEAAARSKRAAPRRRTVRLEPGGVRRLRRSICPKFGLKTAKSRVFAPLVPVGVTNRYQRSIGTG